MKPRIQQILNDLYGGRITITKDDIWMINDECLKFLYDQDNDLETIDAILRISNILYNNTSREVLPLEDGMYDLVIAKYNKITGNKAPVGANPVKLDTKDNVVPVNLNLKEADTGLMDVMTMPEVKGMWYYPQIAHELKPIPEDFTYHEDKTLVEDAKREVSHTYPELVGTLHKCKFVTSKEADDTGVFSLKGNDPIMIFERDFLYPTFPMAYNIAQRKGQDVTLIAELKYDGVSIEMEVAGDSVISAVSRGDTANDEATDYTPIFKGYKFPRAKNVDPSVHFGIKFEAIITYDNLARIAQQFGKVYKNARVAIIGILGSRDARMYRDFITLVPIRTGGLNFTDPVQEIEFLNTYYSNGVGMRYAVLTSSDYTTLLYRVKRFKDEAEYMRRYLGFMYDGVVINYADPDVKRNLGRQNFIDLWSMAIKFNALEKNTYFYGYKYTIGQDGRITPMAYFAPVEFNGSIHDKTTVHSYKRFKDLGLKIGDIVSIKYVNDVICYLSKPDITYNRENPNPVLEFPTHCPSCGSPLMMSDSENTVYCTNPNCPERQLSRISNMLKKLNIKGFSRAYLRKLKVTGLASFLNLKKEDTIPVIGEVMTNKLFERINELKTKPYPDYRLVGAIGFSGISTERWKSILTNVELPLIIKASNERLFNMIAAVKGIGTGMARTIIKERPLMIEDLKTIETMNNVISSFGKNLKGPQIRFSGIRDKELEKAFTDLGYDADPSKSVTRETKVLIVPYHGYDSSKTRKAPPGCLVLTANEARMRFGIR